MQIFTLQVHLQCPHPHPPPPPLDFLLRHLKFKIRWRHCAPSKKNSSLEALQSFGFIFSPTQEKKPSLFLLPPHLLRSSNRWWEKILNSYTPPLPPAPLCLFTVITFD